MFRLLRYFSVTSLIAFVIVTVALALFSRQAAITDLLQLGESKNVALTQAFANSLWPAFAPFVAAAADYPADELSTRPEITELKQAVLAQMDGTTTVKLKVYNLDGLTVFSTQENQIGEDKQTNAGFVTARNGNIVTELSHRDTFSAFEGTIENRDMISSYIPVRVDGEIQGVAELYDDVTPLLQRIETTQRNIVLVVVIILSILYTILFFLVGYADRVIKRQNEAREQAQKAHRESEIRLRTVINSAPIMLWSADKNGKITLLEGSSLTALGINPERGIGQPMTEVYRNIPQIINETNSALGGREFGSLVNVRELAFDTRYTPMRGLNGDILGVTGVATDITERMMAEEALGHSTNNLEHQNQRLKRVHEFFRSTLEHGITSVQRGATNVELLDLLNQAQKEFDNIA